MSNPPEHDFANFVEHYFVRLVRGYALALDDTLVRAWASGHKTADDAGGSWVMPARMFPALAAWLARPERPRIITTRGESHDLEGLTSAILVRGMDPAHRGYWGGLELPAHDQRTVEASMIAYGAWLLRDTLLPTVPSEAQGHLRRWLAHFASAPVTKGNWALFWIVNHAARKALGWEYDQETIDEGWRRIEALHRGDGWMTDGKEGAFDDYNWWVFGTHSLMWMQLDGADDSRLDRVVARLRQRLELFPYFFGSDGSYVEYGRSLAYKFARLGFPVLAYRLGLWPHSAGMLKRLIRLHLSYYDDLGAIDRHTDLVRQTLSEFGSADIREPYIDTGHPYWCMQVFMALWQLDPADDLWTAAEEPLPVEREDFHRSVRPAGWILSGTRASGQVQRHALGTRHGPAAKYSKFIYSTHFPVNVGLVEGDTGPDAALCVTDEERWAHPGHYEVSEAGDRYLRARYVLRLGESRVRCETVLVPDGEGTTRVHRVHIPADTAGLRIVEGGSPLGYPPGAPPLRLFDADAPWSMVFYPLPVASWIYGLAGYGRALRPQGFRGRDELNAVRAHALTPLLEVTDVPAGRAMTLVSYTMATLRPPSGQWAPAEAPSRPRVAVRWEDDGTVHVTSGREIIVAPPLKDAAT